MDSRNYRIKKEKNQEAEREISKIFRNIQKKLEKQKVIRRKRIIKGYDTLILAAMLYIIGQMSFQRLSDVMACVYHVNMSDTAWKKQLTKLAPALFSAMLEYVSNKSKEWTYCKARRVLQCFHSYILDTTRFAVEGGNGTAIQVHTQMSLTDLSDLYMSVTDCHTAESVKHFRIQKKVLYMADRAYGKASQLAELIKKSADFIIRISPNHIRLYQDSQCRKKLSWDKLLSGSDFSITCFIKLKKEIFKLRLVGGMIPEEKHPEIEKRVHRNSSKQQHQLKQSSVHYAKWVLLATTVFHVRKSAILDFYRLRWKIELFFKKAKTLLHFRKIPRSSPSFQKNQVLLWLSLVIFFSQISSLPSYSLFPPFILFLLPFPFLFPFSLKFPPMGRRHLETCNFRES